MPMARFAYRFCIASMERRTLMGKIFSNSKCTGPAGEIHAFHIRGAQASPSRTTIDRWFAGGVGMVKDVTTMRAAKGDLLQRISLELVERPKIMARPEVKSDAIPKQLSVSLAKE